jgi:mono/diheme cytochrome c family protein
MISPPASAEVQNLDQDKSAAKLFATSCADCHRSARGLAKGRFSITLWYYLQQHYTSSSATARTLTAYLQSLDTPARSKAAKPQATKSTATSTSALRPSAVRPPAPMPGR